MRIGCLQFAPQVGDVDNNLERADAILSQADPENLDLLVLPELAFTGYNFKSLREISPHLEPTGAGITSVWARTTALKHNCKVVVGYPETADVSERWPTSEEYYNSAIIVNEDGDICGHYRKSHLYYTDESWALEGSGFFNDPIDGIGQVAMGICMDINPYKFEAPWNAYEFAFHVLDVAANIVILSMAWLTRENAVVFGSQPKEPDMETLTYWITRLEPLIRAETEEEIIVIFANRTGVEDDAVYAGTSAVLGIQNGEVTVYGLLGRGERKLLVVDTEKSGVAKLVYRPDRDAHETDEASGGEPHISPGPDDKNRGPGSSGAPPGSPSDSRRQPDVASPSSNTHRPSSGDPFIDSAAMLLSNTRILSSIDNESPKSPCHVWRQPQLDPLMVRQYPNLGYGNNEEWHSSWKSEKEHSADHLIVPKHSELPSFDGNEARASHLVCTLGDKKMTECLPHEQQTLSGPQTINAVNRRDVGGSRIDESNRGMRRTTSPSRRHRLQRSSTDPQHLPRHVPKLSQKASADIHRKTDRSRASPSQNECPTPNLEKLGADLMVFEGERANRSKRDSLICHVDEDDYVVLRRDTMAKRKQQIAGEQMPRTASHHKTPSQQILYRDDAGLRPVSRTAAVSSPSRKEAKEINNLRSVASKQVSKATFHSRTASQVELPVVGSSYHRKDGKIHSSAENNAHSLAGASFPLTRARQADKHRDSERAGRESRTEKHAMWPTQIAETSNESDNRPPMVGSIPSADVPIMFSIDAPNTTLGPQNASVRDVRAPKRGLAVVESAWKGMPPTPKAMVLPPDFNDGDMGHQIARPRPQNQVSAIVV
ncbi:carbon-nitrogen hydrolase [Xylaria intraflava]|nr:carbon-nitrogen hydrolase [Xylaria intraflava]